MATRAVLATVLVTGSIGAITADVGAEASPDATSEISHPELDFARQVLDVAQNPDVDPAQRAIDTARFALDHRRGQVDADLLPLLDQQARNLDTAEELLALGENEDADPLELGIAIAKVATDWQAATLGLDLGSAEVDTPDHDSPSEAAIALVEHEGGSVTDAQLADLRTLDELPENAQAALTGVIDAFIAFSAATDLAYADADMDRIEALAHLFPDLDTIVDDTGAMLHHLRSVNPASLLADLDIDPAPIFAARKGLLDAVAWLPDALGDPRVQQQSAAAPIQLQPWISIELGLSTSNTYSEDFMLLIDAGGNDVYRNNAGGNVVVASTSTIDRCALLPFLDATIWRSAAAIDLDGTDDYRTGLTCGVTGGGYVGTGFLLDSGLSRDLYTGDTGSGYWGGVGTLLDVGGNDSFAGINGDGALGGSGFLYDGLGNDVYSGGNGSALVGTGFLADASGSDRYTGSNGSGLLGAGFLFDDGVEGDDYSGTSNIQNGSGWLGTGLSIDSAGNDTYAATASTGPANGGGQLGVGSLIDAVGDDSYSAQTGAVNGAGSLGVGLLFDGQGRDTYSDSAGGSGTDRTVVPKGTVGAQIDVPTVPVPPTTTTSIPLPTTTSVPLPPTTTTSIPLPSSTTTTSIPLPPTTVPVPTTIPDPPPLPTTTTSSSTTTSSTTTSSTTTTSVPLPPTTVPPLPGIVTVDTDDMSPCTIGLVTDPMFEIRQSDINDGSPYSVCVILKDPIQFQIRFTVDPNAI